MLKPLDHKPCMPSVPSSAWDCKQGDPSLTPWPVLDESDWEAVQRVLQRAVLYGGPEIDALESEWGEYIGVDHVIAVSSCTHAIHLALASLGVGPGDEVLVPAYTFIGTALPVLHVGAKPVFVDIDPSTYNIDPDNLRRAISPSTKAVVVVHMHGLPFDTESVASDLDEAGVHLVEDACHAHGASVRGRRAGSLGHASCFSLNAVKNLPAGQGGLFCTNDESLAIRARSLASHAVMDGDDYAEPGFSYSLPEITASLARSQLVKLPTSIERAERNAAILHRSLSDARCLSVPSVPPGASHAWHKFVIRMLPVGGQSATISAVKRDQCVDWLRNEDVPCEVWQRRPLPSHQLFGNQRASRFPVASELLDATFCLGTERHPLVAQSENTVVHWARALLRLDTEHGLGWSV